MLLCFCHIDSVCHVHFHHYFLIRLLVIHTFIIMHLLSKMYICFSYVSYCGLCRSENGSTSTASNDQSRLPFEVSSCSTVLY